MVVARIWQNNHPQNRGNILSTRMHVYAAEKGGCLLFKDPPHHKKKESGFLAVSLEHHQIFGTLKTHQGKLEDFQVPFAPCFSFSGREPQPHSGHLHLSKLGLGSTAR